MSPHPVLVIQTMAKILQTAEAYLPADIGLPEMPVRPFHAFCHLSILDRPPVSLLHINSS